jgi:hypothetical protein
MNREVLLNTHGRTISQLLNPLDFCEEALKHAYRSEAEHMIKKLRKNRENWMEKCSALWMLDLDSIGRRGVKEYFVNVGIDARFLELVMKLHNQLSEKQCDDMGAPLAWGVFNAYCQDALAMLSYIYVNDNQEADDCAKIVLEFL